MRTTVVGIIPVLFKNSAVSVSFAHVRVALLVSTAAVVVMRFGHSHCWAVSDLHLFLLFLLCAIEDPVLYFVLPRCAAYGSDPYIQ